MAAVWTMLALLCISPPLPEAHAALPAPALAPGSEAPKAESKPAPPPAVVDVRPTQINMNGNIGFDENGIIRNENANCELTLTMRVQGNTTLLGYRAPRVTKVLLNNGQTLEVKERPPQSFAMPNRRRDSNQAFSFSVPLAFPPPGATSMARIEGVVTILEPEGPESTASLPPIKDVEGKNIRVEGVGPTGAWVMVRRTRKEEGGMLTIEMLQTSWQQCKEVRLLSASGVELPTQDFSVSNQEDKATRMLRQGAPDDARLVFTFVQNVRATEVPFTVLDVPFPGASRAAAGAEIRVQAVPVPQRAKPQPPTTAPSALNVIVE